MPRTVNTGLGALFILVAPCLLGGETLTDFALALLVGILVGDLLVGVHRHAPPHRPRAAGIAA